MFDFLLFWTIRVWLSDYLVMMWSNCRKNWSLVDRSWTSDCFCPCFFFFFNLRLHFFKSIAVMECQWWICLMLFCWCTFLQYAACAGVHWARRGVIIKGCHWNPFNQRYSHIFLFFNNRSIPNSNLESVVWTLTISKCLCWFSGEIVSVYLGFMIALGWKSLWILADLIWIEYFSN